MSGDVVSGDVVSSEVVNLGVPAVGAAGAGERTVRLRRLAQDRLVDQPGTTRSDLVEAVRAADPLLDSATVAGIVTRAGQQAGGLALIEGLLADEAVTEVMVNGPGPVWWDRHSRLEETGLILDRHDIGLLIERILDPLGLRVDRTSPYVDARLPDGSRVNVVLPPLALDGPVVTIRRFSRRPIGLSAFGDATVVAQLAELVAQRATILVVGATGAGKTTLLNALASLIDPAERVVSIEDTAELRLPGRHVVRLEARPPNSEGVGAVDLRALVRNALRMRPDRLVIGEVRGPEALDLVLALNTGHRGSLATCHASGPSGALRRLEALSLLGGADVPVAAVRSQLADAVDAIVTVARTGADRRVVDITAVAPAPGNDLGAAPRLTRMWPR